MMIQAFIAADAKDSPDRDIIEYIKKLPKQARQKDDTLREYIKSLKFRWEHGTKVERTATLGWNDAEALELFCSIVDNGDRIKGEYMEMEKMYGKPKEFEDKDLEQFENAMKVFRTKK